jgi:hypothetical protein
MSESTQNNSIESDSTYDNCSHDDNSVVDYLLTFTNQSIKYLSEATNSAFKNPYKFIVFAYFNVDKKTGQIVQCSFDTFMSKWLSIVLNYLKQIGFGNITIGFLIAIALLPVTIFSIISFSLSLILIFIFAPFTLGLSLLALIPYTLITIFISVILSCLWVGLVAAILGIGFVYNNNDNNSDIECDIIDDTQSIQSTQST